MKASGQTKETEAKFPIHKEESNTLPLQRNQLPVIYVSLTE